MSSKLADSLMTSRGWFRFITITVVIVLGVAIAGHIHGRILAGRDMAERDEIIQQLRAHSDELTMQLTNEVEKFDALQAKFASVQAALDAIVPSENAYDLLPNQSIVVGGQMTVGLVGSPTIQGVYVNVNGKRQLAAVGDVISISPDASTTCQVAVQSFDMFKAVLTASCTPTKAQ